MGQVVLKVNGRDFAVTCIDGEEARVRLLAQYVDGKVGEFAKNLGQVGESRLLLLAALAIADELSDANDALQQQREVADSADSAPDTERSGGTSEPTIKSAASSIEEIAQRIESIAARIETP